MTGAAPPLALAMGAERWPGATAEAAAEAPPPPILHIGAARARPTGSPYLSPPSSGGGEERS